MLAVIILLGVFFGAFYLIAKAAKEKEAMHNETSETIMRPLLNRTFGQCFYDPNGYLTDNDMCGALYGHMHPRGHDLVEANYKGVHIKFSPICFYETNEEDYIEFSYVGLWTILDKRNPITKRIYVTQANPNKKKTGLITGDPLFDSICNLQGDPNEATALLDKAKRDKLVEINQKHQKVMVVFESDRIQVGYEEGDPFMPSKRYDSNQLYNMQMADYLDLLDMLVEL